MHVRAKRLNSGPGIPPVSAGRFAASAARQEVAPEKYTGLGGKLGG